MKRIMLILSVVCLLCGRPLFAQAGGPDAARLKDISKSLGLSTDFQALVEIRVGDGDMSFLMRIYASEKATRTEMELPGGVGTMTTLTIDNNGQNDVYMLSPAQKSYTKLPKPEALAKVTAQKTQDVQVVSLGKETKNGLPCEKIKVTQGDNQLFAWVTERDGKKEPVCLEMKEGLLSVAMTFKEYVPGSQEPGLLKLPADYQEANPFEAILNIVK